MGIERIAPVMHYLYITGRSNTPSSHTHPPPPPHAHQRKVMFSAYPKIFLGKISIKGEVRPKDKCLKLLICHVAREVTGLRAKDLTFLDVWLPLICRISAFPACLRLVQSTLCRRRLHWRTGSSSTLYYTISE